VTSPSADELWYFAYGSNMQRETFVVRRGMRPSRSRVGRVEGYALVFDLPVGSVERGVANLRTDPTAVIYGVLHRITTSELEVLDRTEGVPQGIYDRHEIRVFDSDEVAVTAITYVSRHRVDGRKPSPRYMGLIVEGARQHGLPVHYVDSLLAIPLAIDERESIGTD